MLDLYLSGTQKDPFYFALCRPFNKKENICIKIFINSHFIKCSYVTLSVAGGMRGWEVGGRYSFVGFSFGTPLCSIFPFTIYHKLELESIFFHILIFSS